MEKENNSNPIFEIKRTLQTIGNQTFIKYFKEFEKNENLDFKMLFEGENWKKTSINPKIVAGKKIFKKGWQKTVLEIILSSRSDEKTLNDAFTIFSEKYPTEELNTLRFIRPEFIFGEDIIKNLFEGYSIKQQYSVENYKVDWYIPELNLVIEFDEKHHHKNREEDEKRKRFIEKKLNGSVN